MKKVSAVLKDYIVDAAALIALGLVLLIWPQWSLKIIFTWLGIGLIVMGVVKTVLFFTKKEKTERRAANLLAGLLQIAVGIIAIVKAEFLAAHFPLAAGILLAYGAIVMIVRALRLKDGGKNAFMLSLVLGIVCLVLATVVFVHPVLLANVMMQAAGASMIVEGVSLLIVLSRPA